MRIPKRNHNTLLESLEPQLVSASLHPTLPQDLAYRLRTTRSLEERPRRIGRCRSFEMLCPFLFIRLKDLDGVDQ